MNGLGQKRNAADKAEEFARKYGSVERVLWIQRQPSAVSGKTPCVNAHMAHEGMGRKGHYTTIIPLTREEHDEIEKPNGGIKTWSEKYNYPIESALRYALLIEEQWQRELAKVQPAW